MSSSPLMWEDTGQLTCVASKLGPPCGEEDYSVVTDSVNKSQTTKVMSVEEDTTIHAYFNLKTVK